MIFCQIQSQRPMHGKITERRFHISLTKIEGTIRILLDFFTKTRILSMKYPVLVLTKWYTRRTCFLNFVFLLLKYCIFFKLFLNSYCILQIAGRMGRGNLQRAINSLHSYVAIQGIKMKVQKKAFFFQNLEII